jgi:hypothetical protein
MILFFFFCPTRSYPQVFPSQPPPTTLARLSDRHLPNYALVIDQRRVVTTALLHLHPRNLPSYLFTHLSTASP